MKKILNFVKNLLIFVYVIVVIFVTICLLSYNDYKVTVLGTTSIIPITDDNLKPDYALGDLLMVKRNKVSDVKVGDKIFFYRTRTGETSIYFAEVTNTERVTDKEYTYTVEGDYRLSSSTYIGKTSTATVIPKVGKFLSFIESKWGFLFLVVFPTLIIFLYTLYSVVLEVRDGDKEEIENKSKVEEKREEKKEIIENKISEDKKEPAEESIIEEKEKHIEKKETAKLEENTEKENEENKENKIEVEESKKVETQLPKIETEQELEKQPKIEEKSETDEQSKVKEEPKLEEQSKIETTKIEEELKTETTSKVEEQPKAEVAQKTEEQRKKELIEAKLKSMTEEEKKALLRAKLNSMTEEEKRALLEKKRKEKSGN